MMFAPFLPTHGLADRYEGLADEDDAVLCMHKARLVTYDIQIK